MESLIEKKHHEKKKLKKEIVALAANWKECHVYFFINALVHKIEFLSQVEINVLWYGLNNCIPTDVSRTAITT